MNLNEMAAGSAPEQPSAQKQATPEQQAQFDTLLGSVRQIIGASAEEWMATLKLDPVGAAVKMGTAVVRHMVQKYDEAGQPFAPEVIIHVGITVVKDIAGIVNEAGLVPDDKLEGYIRDVMQQSIAEYSRMDAEDGLMDEQKLPGDPTTPDDTKAHEGAETPALEQQEMAAEPPEQGKEAMNEQDEMALQLQNIRAARTKRGTK